MSGLGPRWLMSFATPLGSTGFWGVVHPEFFFQVDTPTVESLELCQLMAAKGSPPAVPSLAAKLTDRASTPEEETQDGVAQLAPKSPEVVNLTRCWLAPTCSDQAISKVSSPTKVMLGLSTVPDPAEEND